MNTRTRFASALVTAALLVVPASARADDWFVSPFFGAQFGGDAPHTSPGIGVSAGWLGHFVVGGEGEVTYAPEFFGRNGFLTERRVTTVMGTALVPVPWGRTKTFTPYGAFGLGTILPKLAEAGDLVTLDERVFGMNVGGGAMAFVNEHVGLRGDVRYVRALRKPEDNGEAFGLDLSTFHFWRASIGLVAKF